MLVFNENIIGATGYRTTDLNGDFFIEIGDISITFHNLIREVYSIFPSY